VDEGAVEPRAGGEDPLSADRRTLVIAAAAMVALIAIGVVSAAVFTRSACGAVTPELVAMNDGGRGAVDGQIEATLADALSGLDEQQVAELLDGLALLGDDEASPEAVLRGAADVGAATALTELDGDLVATGPRLTVLHEPGPDDRQAAAAGPTAEVDEPAVVVGDGPTLYSLALVNELTGQVDAIVPVTGGLDAGECFDTAQVGIPLTFHLDADDGELLLFRVDDDGDHPEVEVRDADGSVHSERIVLGAGPPGALAERLDGLLGEELVVTARRTRADEQPPAIQARDRSSGDERWSVAPSEVAQFAPPGDEALELSLVAVTDDLVLVAVSREDRRPVQLLALDAEDGSDRWISDIEAHGVPKSVGARDGALVVIAPRGGEEEPATQQLLHLDLDDGSPTLLAARDGDRARAASSDGRLWFGVGGALTAVAGDGEQRTATLPVEVADLAATDDLLAVLLRDGDDGAVVWLAP
jgi:hypothetical protein